MNPKLVSRSILKAYGQRRMKMQVSELKMATILSDVAMVAIRRVVPLRLNQQQDVDFSDSEKIRIAHNFLCGEFDRVYASDGFTVPAWALSTKTTHRKEERTPAEHIKAILRILHILGWFTRWGVNPTEESIARSAEIMHKGVRAVQEEVAELLPRMSLSLRHDQHSREFCDDFVRNYLESALTVPAGHTIGSVLDHVMPIVDMYHDAWGF